MGQDYKIELETVTKFYGLDLNKDDLKTQLLCYRAKFKELKLESVDLDYIVKFMKQPGYSDLSSEIATILKLIFVLPATDAESERLFSK